MVGKITLGVRWINVPDAVNIYIGQGSPLGNPFAHKGMNVLQRDNACNQFEDYLTRQVKDLDSPQYKEMARIYHMVINGFDVNLQCFCSHKGLRCHGESIKTKIENAIEKKIKG